MKLEIIIKVDGVERGGMVIEEDSWRPSNFYPTTEETFYKSSHCSTGKDWGFRYSVGAERPDKALREKLEREKDND